MRTGILGEQPLFSQEHGFPCCSSQLGPWIPPPTIGPADDKEYVSPTIVPPRSGNCLPRLGGCLSLQEWLLRSPQMGLAAPTGLAQGRALGGATKLIQWRLTIEVLGQLLSLRGLSASSSGTCCLESSLPCSVLEEL